MESCPGLCPWTIIGGLTPCFTMFREKATSHSENFYLQHWCTSYPLSFCKIKKKSRQDFIIFETNWTKYEENHYSRYTTNQKLVKTTATTPTSPPSHTRTLHHHQQLKQFIELTTISYEARLSKAVTIALYCYLKNGFASEQITNRNSAIQNIRPL